MDRIRQTSLGGFGNCSKTQYAAMDCLEAGETQTQSSERPLFFERFSK
jgi:hypothetical protein